MYCVLGQNKDTGKDEFLSKYDYLPSYWELKFDYPDHENFYAIEPKRVYDINKPRIEAEDIVT